MRKRRNHDDQHKRDQICRWKYQNVAARAGKAIAIQAASDDYSENKYVPKSAIVWMLKINVYTKEEANIGYDLQDHYGRCFYDSELFATEDEAEFECIRLNEILEREENK